MFGWASRPGRHKGPSFVRRLFDDLLEEDDRRMHVRKTVIRAIADLSPDQRAQLLLYLLGDDWGALDVIDGGKWRFQEHVPWAELVAGAPIPDATDSSAGISEGEGLS